MKLNKTIWAVVDCEEESILWDHESPMYDYSEKAARKLLRDIRKSSASAKLGLMGAKIKPIRITIDRTTIEN